MRMYINGGRAILGKNSKNGYLEVFYATIV